MSRRRALGRAHVAVSAALVALAATVAVSPQAGAEAQKISAESVVGSGTLTRPVVGVLAKPHAKARPVAVLKEFRPDYRPQYVLALAVVENSDGQAQWYRVSVPGRPNGRTGWISASSVDLTPVSKRIVIDRGARRFQFWQGRRLLRTGRVVVGKRSTETPLGLFYVTWKFDPNGAGGLGDYAFETSAYSNLSDWPGGGIVGVHGTSSPQFLGQAVSHGCVRLHNRDINFLRTRVPIGTPIAIVP
jgi:lipoprotein-anchoring transpeptidase ErfK/SrfK